MSSMLDIVRVAKDIMSIMHAFVFCSNLLFDCGERWGAVFRTVVLSAGKGAIGIVVIVGDYLILLRAQT